MVRLSQYERAKILAKGNYVQLIHARVDLITPLFLFIIPEQDVRVTFNHKGWVSDWTETPLDYAKRCYRASIENRPMPKNRASSTFLVGKEDDVYILACKLYLKLIGFPVDNKTNPDCSKATDEIIEEVNKVLRK